VVSNHDRLEAGAGFDDHRHADVDIVTFVVAGSLEHADSAGHREVLSAGELQVLRAGSGVVHSERNASATEPVEYVQMWLRSTNTEVSYERPTGAAVLPGGELSVVALEPGAAFVLAADRLAHGYLVGGSAMLADGGRLAAGDAVRLVGGSLGVVAETHSRLLAWRLRKD
jgi:redox-sensitive bicupin YhaK (pirin superfamily)